MPLGLADIQLWARDPATQGKRASRYERPIEEKENAKWLSSYAAASTLQQRCPDSLVVSVGDREADVYEWFVAAAQQPEGARLLLRAERTRRMTEDHGSLWACREQRPLTGVRYLVVPRQGSRPARTAGMQVRFAAVELKAPKRKLPQRAAVGGMEPRSGPARRGEKPLAWMLLTTVPVETLQQACERLAWYAMRWQIEVYHRTLKSGRRIAERQLGSARRLQACLAQLPSGQAWARGARGALHGVLRGGPVQGLVGAGAQHPHYNAPTAERTRGRAHARPPGWVPRVQRRWRARHETALAGCNASMTSPPCVSCSLATPVRPVSSRVKLAPAKPGAYWVSASKAR